jgi:hypothetical protein
VGFAQSQVDTTIPTPKAILGYNLGYRYTSHAGVEKYLRAVHERAAKRMQLFSYGATYENRTLYLAVFSSPENIARLDSIKANIQRLADPRRTSDADAEQIIKSMPAIVWLSYGVHGNEASATEAALNVIYQLASRNDPEVTALLNTLVIIIDPLLNPDGHERYVNYEITHAGANPVDDKNAVEHNEDWPSGRTNHYYFDLNRDWAWLTQTESKARVKAYLEWKPQVHCDYHEMGYNSSYFFFPAFKPINKNYPKSTMIWGEIYGKANAAAFDAKGLKYWSGESFDLFYPGYGDSWPSLNGAIGMTYEQAGQTGVKVLRSDEEELTLKDRLEHHSLTSWTTIKTTAEHKEDRMRDFYKFFKEAVDEGATGKTKDYIIDPSNDAGRAAKLAALLTMEGVEVFKSDREMSVSGVSTYFSNSTVDKKFPAGTYVIPTAQPSKRLITALLEQEPALTDTFFYDISTWSLPIAYGVSTYWTGSKIAIPTERITDVEHIEGTVPSDSAAYAFLFKWNTNNAIKSLAWLLQHNYKAGTAMKDFTIGDEYFPRGTIIIPVSGNPPDLYQKLKYLAKEHGVDFYAAKSGYTEHGINLGSDRVVRLKKPRIIVVTGSPVNNESYGAIWAMFDIQYGVDFIPMKLSQLRNADLHDYTAIVFPDDGSGGHGYKSQLDSSAIQKIKTWVSGGGTFVGIEGGATFASLGKISGVKLKEKKEDADSSKKGAKLSDEELEKRMTVEEKERKDRLGSIPGTIMRVKLDNSHPLGFGYDTSIAVFKTNETMYELSDKGYNVGIYTKSPRLSGYISKENEKMLEDSPFLIQEKLGAGNVVLFADDPNFRCYWDGLNKLFFSSVLLMPSIRDVSLSAGDAFDENEH